MAYHSANWWLFSFYLEWIAVSVNRSSKVSSEQSTDLFLSFVLYITLNTSIKFVVLWWLRSVHLGPTDTIYIFTTLTFSQKIFGPMPELKLRISGAELLTGAVGLRLIGIVAWHSGWIELSFYTSITVIDNFDDELNCHFLMNIFVVWAHFNWYNCKP